MCNSKKKTTTKTGRKILPAFSTRKNKSKDMFSKNNEHITTTLDGSGNILKVTLGYFKK